MVRCQVCKEVVIADLEAHELYGQEFIHVRCKVGAIIWGGVKLGFKILIILSLLAAYALMCRKANAGETVQVKCGAYGRLVECKINYAGDLLTKWGATRYPMRDEDRAYLSYGNSISFMLKGKDVYQIDLHFPDVSDFQPLRVWARWQKDPRDRVWKVMFSNIPIE